MDIDEFMILMLVEHETESRAASEERFRASLLDLFVAADAKGTGLLSLEAWQVLLADQGRHMSEAVPLYRRMLEATTAVGEDPMATVASSSGLGGRAGAPAPAPAEAKAASGVKPLSGVSLAAFVEV